MFERVGTVSLFVSDQERAKKFYTEILGFELRTDAEMYPGAPTRWIEIAPPGADTAITLSVPDDNWTHYRGVVGKSQALTFQVSELTALWHDLRAKGVVFIQEPKKEAWGFYAIMQDSEDNSLILVEERAEG